VPYTPTTWLPNDTITDVKLNNAEQGIANAIEKPATPAQGDVLYYNGTTWARLAAGAVEQFLQTRGTGANPVWASPTTPWTVDVMPMTTPLSQVNFSVRDGNSTSVVPFFLRSSGAIDAYVEWDVVLGAGTWTVELMHTRQNDAGIYTVSLDGVSVGTIDGYNVSSQFSFLSSITSVAVAATAKITARLTMATKHASSSSYFGRVHWLQFRRTA
jgi:hypothetical protein